MSRGVSTLRRFVRVMRLLQSKPMTADDLKRELHCKEMTARNWLVTLQDEGVIEFKGFAPKKARGFAPARYGWKP